MIMNTPDDINDKLFSYLDGQLTDQERQNVEKLLESNPALKAKLQEYKQMDAMLKGIRLEEPAKNFTQVLMQRLDRPATSVLTIRNSLLLLAGIMIAVGICVLLLSAGFFDQDRTTIDLNTVAIKNKYIQNSIPVVSISGKLIVNVVILLNLVLAFLVLDRAVLKPFFQRRMQVRH
jgi:anti-sigma factor RsiW